MQCVICKKDIQEGEVTVETPQGTVHAGPCLEYLDEMAVNESTDSLNEVQLLL